MKRSSLIAAVILLQCYATRSQSGCEPIGYPATMAECRDLARDYTRFDSRALRATGLPALVRYKCMAN